MSYCGNAMTSLGTILQSAAIGAGWGEFANGKCASNLSPRAFQSPRHEKRNAPVCHHDLLRWVRRVRYARDFFIEAFPIILGKDVEGGCPLEHLSEQD